MAKLANTLVSTDSKTNLEELSDVVSKITPEDTPLYTMIGKGSASSTHPEWSTDELAVPGDNFQSEGDEFEFESVTVPKRMGNYTQIFRKSWAISKTQQAVSDAGSAVKAKRQKLKKGVEVRKDVEYALLGNTASTATDPRKFGSLCTWYETNVSRGTGGANGGYKSNTGLTAAATAGTKRAFSKALLDQSLQQAYQSGANIKTVMVSPYVKTVFTTFMSDPNVAQFRYAAQGGKNTIVATADIYESDFGKVAIVTNRVMAANATTASNVHLIDPAMLQWKWLRSMGNVPGLAKTGDAETGVIIGEGTLCVKNEKGLGCIADVFGLTAAS